MEEVRLMESRKSLRLMDQHLEVDFARLAEGGPAALNGTAVSNGLTAASGHHTTELQHAPRKRSSSGSTTGIDVPGAFVG